MSDDDKKLLAKLKKEGFIFFEQDMDADLVESFLSLKFSDCHCPEGSDSTWQVEEFPQDIENRYKSWLMQHKELANLVPTLNYSVHCFKKDEYMNVHSDYVIEGDYQILTWICKDDDFVGRDFIHGFKVGNHEQTNKVKPKTGLTCLCDSTMPHFVHGVSKLLTDTTIITVLGSLD